MTKQKLIRITTVPISLDKLLEGQLRFMSSFYEVIAVSSDKEYLNKIQIKEQVKVANIEMTRTISPIKDLVSLYKMYVLFKTEKPFIVHSHTPKAGVISMLAAKIAAVPIRLHTVAGLPLTEATGIKRKVLNFVEKATYWAATKVYPNSLGLKEIILENDFCNESKLKVIANGSSNGININYFNPSHFTELQNNELREKLKIDHNDFVFVFVGRLVSDKGINELVSAFVQLTKQNQNCKLLLVGPFESELDPLKANTLLEIKNNTSIISLGYQNDVRPYLAISNCLTFPSYREGFPNVVMQAGAMGLPSIVSDINGCNEIIIPNKNGIIIPVKSQQKLFEAMLNMIEDCQLFKQMKLNARLFIESRYSQQVVWDAILEEYCTFEK